MMDPGCGSAPFPRIEFVLDIGQIIVNERVVFLLHKPELKLN